MTRRAALWALALLVAVAVIGLGVGVLGERDDRGASPPPVATATTPGGVEVPAETKVDSEDPGRAPDETLTVPQDALSEAAASEVGGHDDLRDETPEGVTDAELDEAQEQQEDLRRSDQLPLVTPDAAPSVAGCLSQFVRNYSSRGGIAPRLIVVHYTVSRNQPGWTDNNVIVSLFNTPSFMASSTYVYDFEGHCSYIVRESDKPWTQATFNPVSISVEVIAYGDEGRFLQGEPLAKLGRILAASAKRWRIPVQVGAVSGCTVTRPGIVTHQMLGSCGGGHHDISPFTLAPIVQAIQDAANPLPKSPNVKEHYPLFKHLTAGEKDRAKMLLRVRRKIVRRGGDCPQDAPNACGAAQHVRRSLQHSIGVIGRLDQSKRHHGDRQAVLRRIVAADWRR